MFGFLKKKQPKPPVSAVIAAAGTSSRMGGFDKLMAPLDGVEVLIRAIQAFERCAAIDEIVLVTGGERIVEYSNLISAYRLDKVARVVSGGQTRLESVYKGLCEVDRSARYVAVHDGARPLISPELIAAVCEKAFTHTCAIAAAPVTDTLKRHENGAVLETVDRNALCLAQTPQVCDIDVLRAALEQAMRAGVHATDESMAVEALGFKPAIVLSERPNLKITYPKDIAMAEALLPMRCNR